MSIAKCRNCETIVESKHRHDWVTCKCYSNQPLTRGFYLDGGNDYIRCGGNLADIEWLDPKIKGFSNETAWELPI